MAEHRQGGGDPARGGIDRRTPTLIEKKGPDAQKWSQVKKEKTEMLLKKKSQIAG